MNLFIFVSLFVGILTISLTASFIVVELIPGIIKEYANEIKKRWKK